MRKGKKRKFFGRMSEADYVILSYVMQERLLMNMAERRMAEHADNDDFCDGMAMMAYELGYECGKNEKGEWVFVRDSDGLPKKDWTVTSELLLEAGSPFCQEDCDGEEENCRRS